MPMAIEMFQETRPNAGRFEMADHFLVRPGPGAHGTENLLHLDDVAFHAGDFGNRR